MASYSAQLEVAGHTYPVVLCTYSFTQATGARGRVNERVRHGLLELVLDVPDGDQLLLWAATPHYPLDGHVAFYQENDMMARESVAFSGGQCVHYQETFEAGADLIGSYRCALTIAAPKLELLTGGAAGAYVPPAARAYAAPVAAAASVAAAVAASPASPTAWIDVLEQQLQAGPGTSKTVQKWLANGLNADKLRAAMQGPNYQKDFIRLMLADKGLYQQRVVIDDYDAIPGVSPQPYVSNSLPKKLIPASDFGVPDTDLDLPADKATTFTDSARLVKLKAGEKLYRVANDPTTDPYGRTGGYWTRTSPTVLSDVVGGTAVMPEWNNYQQVYEFTVPDPGPGVPDYHAWEGPAAAQPVSKYYEEKETNGYCLAGGDNQLFLPNKFTRSPDFGTHITDVTAQHNSWPTS